MEWRDILNGILYWIGPVILFLIIFGRFILPVILRGYLKNAEKKGDICDKCKGKMITTHSSLYLIPATFDHEHDRSSGYYIRNATPIESEEQIPTGSRACRMHVLQCQNCGCREVGVVDFLRVRGEEVVKAIDVYPYEEFADFLYR